MSLSERVRDTVWPRRGVAGQLGYLALRPLSGLFRIGVGLRGLGYKVGALRVRRAAIPVVSVGNLAVGGTGKTPVTLWLARALAARGVRVGVVSRGYGGSARGVTVVSRGNGPELPPEQAGDEPVMMARSFGGPVITAARRIDGVNAAAELGCECVVLDDGFQHRAIARAFDLVLLDGRSGPLLPAGPLREPMAAVRRADAVGLVSRDEEALLEPPAVDVPVHRMRLDTVALVESVAGVWRERSIGELAGRHVVAVAGIAQPESFYGLVHRWDAVIDEVFEFADHYRYTREDWQRIARSGHASELIVTTEKDLVKLEAFPFATGKLVALRIAPIVERADELIEAILAKTGLRAAPAEDTRDGDQS